MTSRLWLSLVLAASIGCGGASARERPETPRPTELCRDEGLAADEFCMPIERLDVLARPESAELLGVRVAPHGFTRPRRVTLELPDGSTGERIVVEAKWKPAPRGGGGFNNRPRKELAAYAIQQWFLDPDAYVIPPTFGVCVPIDRYREELSSTDPTFDGARCVFGILAYWLQNATSDGVWDAERFEKDPAYRESFANLNLLTYLIDHRDGRPSNFLRSTDPKRPRVFSIDNGLAFGGPWGLSTWFRINPRYSELRVRSFPRRSIDRLRAIDAADLARLAVVSEYRKREDGLTPVDPGRPLEGGDGIRVSGSALQLGLKEHEIEAIDRRLRDLLERVDRGELDLF